LRKWQIVVFFFVVQLVLVTNLKKREVIKKGMPDKDAGKRKFV
jgi:hypothetical protein